MTCHHMLYLFVMELETWYVMFIRPPVGNMAACTQPRHVYVDLGVNWGNTARLYETIAANTSASASWEVFGFEAAPLIQPYAEQFFAFLNGQRSEPLSCLRIWI